VICGLGSQYLSFISSIPDTPLAAHILFTMPRIPTIHVSEPKQWFPCLVAYCAAKFRSMNGRTQHIRAKHTSSDELQQDDSQDFPVVSGSWPRSSSPQSEPMDEDNLLQTSNGFEPSSQRSVHASESESSTLSNNNNFQQLDEPSDFFPQSPSKSSSLHPTSRSSPLQYKEAMRAECHPSIYGKYIIFFF
jgi:hypothetical protein